MKGSSEQLSTQIAEAFSPRECDPDARSRTMTNKGENTDTLKAR